MAVGVLDDALKGGTNAGFPPLAGKEFNRLQPFVAPHDEEDFMVTHAQARELPFL